MSVLLEERSYQRDECVVFCKTNEQFGGLSNMAAGYPLVVNGIHIRTSEALYQACRFPHMPEVQMEIIDQASPMAAKMKSKPHRDRTRPDWDAVRVKIMRWCLRVKLAQNWDKFSTLLLSTGGNPIVEETHKRDFWGAKADKANPNTLVGVNRLGRLLEELKDMVRDSHVDRFLQVVPLTIPSFDLYGQPIAVVHADDVQMGDSRGTIQLELLLGRKE